MHFFARLVFICNICFLIALVMRLVDISAEAHNKYETPLGSQPIIGIILILYFISIFLNCLFLVVCLIRVIAKKTMFVPRWLLIVNVLLFPLQVYYLFF